MNNFRPNKLVFLFLLLNSASCDKNNDKDVLPPATQEGKNTFGCLINNVVWLPEGYVTFPSPNLNADITETQFSINAKRSEGQYISIDIQQPLTVGTYYLKDSLYSNKTNKCYAVYGNQADNSYFQTNSVSNGVLEIMKYDPQRRIVSGNFRFVASKFKILGTNPANFKDSTISIMEGRFDITY